MRADRVKSGEFILRQAVARPPPADATAVDTGVGSVRQRPTRRMATGPIKHSSAGRLFQGQAAEQRR
jgi:hypothetical protein